MNAPAEHIVRSTAVRSTDRDRSGVDRCGELQVTSSLDGAITVCGDLDVASADLFERELRLREGAPDDDRAVVIDVRGVGFMDSSGLRILVAASLRAGHRGSRLVLRNPGPELTRLLEITGLSEQLGVPESPTGAGRPRWTRRSRRRPDDHARGHPQ